MQETEDSARSKLNWIEGYLTAASGGEGLTAEECRKILEVMHAAENGMEMTTLWDRIS